MERPFEADGLYTKLIAGVFIQVQELISPDYPHA
jgi:hypothetical protein